MSIWQKTCIATLACLIAFAFSQIDAQAATLKLTNKSSSDLHSIYISPSGTDNWEENIIEGMMLPSGNEVDVEIPNYQSFDLMVKDDQGGEEDYRDFPGKTKQITIQGGGQSTHR